MITIEDFAKLDIRVGEIIEVLDLPEARKPMYRMTIDFGPEIGTKQSCGQFTKLYTKDELLHKKVLGAINLPPRHIGPAVSEVLTLGVSNEKDEAILIIPDKETPLGSKLY